VLFALGETRKNPRRRAEIALNFLKGKKRMPEMVESNLGEPRHEAAFFYGLFIRGVPLEKLRADIDVSPAVLQRWQRQALHDPWYQRAVERVLAYRKNVLAIFDSLIIQVLEPPTQRIQ
jgi:hypothetical protein